MTPFQQQQANKILSSYNNFDEILEKSLSNDENDIEKGGKRAEIGEIRTWGGKKHVKHADGWVYVNEKTGKGKVSTGTSYKSAEDHHIEHYKKYIEGDSSEDKKESASIQQVSSEYKLLKKLADQNLLNAEGIKKIQKLKDILDQQSSKETPTSVKNTGDSKFVDSKKEEKNEDGDSQQKKLEQKNKELFNSLPDEKNPLVYAFKAGRVSAKNIKDNEIIQAWGDNTAYFLVDDKYIIGGSGKVQHYIGKNLEMRLTDDGNETTRFYDNIFQKRKVTLFANNIDDFAAQLPKGSFNLYAMK